MVEGSPSRLIRLRYAGSCVVCTQQVDAGTQAWWDPSARSVTCVTCKVPDPPAFVAGRSAQRRADKTLDAERERLARAGRLKRAAVFVFGYESKSKSWARGAEGERIVGRLLDQLEEEGLIVALHDIRIPGSSANVDHIAVAPSGVHIIDAKLYKGRVEVVNRGGWINKDIQLRVAKRNRTNLIDKLTKQILTVDGALRDYPLPTPVTPVLCFANADWPTFTSGYKLNGVHIVWPKKLVQLLRRPGPLGPEHIAYVGTLLRQRLRPA